MEKLKRTATMILAAAMLLLPSMSIAGNLEPSGPPAPTMKTLDQIPPTWSLTLPVEQRFERLVNMNNSAVLDKETGLVWTWLVVEMNINWAKCFDDCRSFSIGGRMGWRLPTIEELGSLLESPADWAPATLPAGHPFSPPYVMAPLWSTTSPYGEPSKKLKMDLSTGAISSADVTESGWAICVRGGAGVEN